MAGDYRGFDRGIDGRNLRRLFWRRDRVHAPGNVGGLGMRDIHAMGAIRTLLSVVINAAAVLTFIVARAVFWPQCVVMIAGAVTGGWFGAHYAQKADPRKVRLVVIAIGVAMTAYYFVTLG